VAMQTDKIPVLHLQNNIPSHLGSHTIAGKWWRCSNDYKQDCTP